MRPNIEEDEMTSVNAKHEALLDALLKDYTDPQDILGEHGLLKQLTKRVVERVLEAELTAHLGYAPHVRHGTEEQNARNGKGRQCRRTPGRWTWRSRATATGALRRSSYPSVSGAWRASMPRC